MQEIITQTKYCHSCNQHKYVCFFSKSKRTKDGFASQCKQCVKLYRDTNKKNISEKNKEYYEKNKNAILSRHKIYRSLNSQKINIYMVNYRKTEKGNSIQQNSDHKRRTKTKEGDITSEQLLHLKKSTKLCYWCNESLKNKKVHIDHYTPLSKGGEHTLSNIVISCSNCNQKKSYKDPLLFAQSLGKLL